MQDCIITRPDKPVARFVFAHGAGAPMDSDFMQQMTELLYAQDIEVVRFEFPYMAMRREDGKKRPPNPMPKLLEAYRATLDQLDKDLPLFIGGKSMGGRVASILASEGNIELAGVACLGYPFHPPGKKDTLRTAHFNDIKCPLLVLQGERDTFGNKALVDALALPESFTLVYLDDGDHSFLPRKRSGITEAQNLEKAALAFRSFVDAV